MQIPTLVFRTLNVDPNGLCKITSDECLERITNEDFYQFVNELGKSLSKVREI